MVWKLTTDALKKNQYLIEIPSLNMFEFYCLGYTDGKRDTKIDGWYLVSDLRLKNE